MFHNKSRHHNKFRSSIGLFISETPFEDPLNAINTPDLLPNLLPQLFDHTFFKFKMNEENNEELEEIFSSIFYETTQESQISGLEPINSTSLSAQSIHNYSGSDTNIPFEVFEELFNAQTDNLIVAQQQQQQQQPTQTTVSSTFVHRKQFYSQDFQAMDSESSQASTDSELNTGFNKLSTTSPSHFSTFDDNNRSPFVPSTSGQISIPNYGSHAFVREAEIGFIHTQQAMHLSAVQNANPSTSSGLPPFHQTFCSNIATNLSQPINSNVVTNEMVIQPESTTFTNFEQCVEPQCLEHSQSMPNNYSEWIPNQSGNTFGYPIESISEPDIRRESRGRGRVSRGKEKVTAASKYRILEFEKQRLEEINQSYRQKILYLQRNKEKYENMFFAIKTKK